jgi:adenylate cyclase
MFTDQVGYTSLSQKDEASAMELLDEQRRVARSFFPKYNGREIKTIGDAFLVEFESALEAVRCAFDMQQSLHELNMGRKIEKRIQLRIGVHLGDVIHSQNDVYGDAVNVASRIEPLAPPGGVCITEQVNDHVKNKSDFQLMSLGRKELKNVGEPVEVFRIVFPWERQEVINNIDRKRIAVLPFANLSSDPEEGYFADGMTEELITSLSGVRQLTVIARTSIMKYKNSQKGASDIGKELNAGALIEGSVRKAGNRVRITAQLIDTSSEGHLWAQNYDRQLDDIFGIQSEIAEKVAGELKIRLVESEKRLIEKKATENTEAYTCYLRAKELLREADEKSLRQSKTLFEKAIDLDPSFARAYSGLSDCFLDLANDVYEPYEQGLTKAEIFVKKALQFDPELAEAHATLGRLYFLTDYVRASETETKRAIELNPSIPESYATLGNIELLKGEKEEGLKNWEFGYRLDPVSPRFIERLGLFYLYLGKEEDALSFWERTIHLAPAGTYRSKTEYYLAKGNFKEAKEFFTMAERQDPTNSWVNWMRGFIAAQTGDKEGALLAIRKIEENWQRSGDLNGIAFIHHALGDLDSYFAFINKATDQHTVRYWYVMYCPLLATSRADPRYREFLDKIGKMIG